MMDERYKIEVSDEAVEITGTLTIREAFDFLNFFEREGYTTLEDWSEHSTLYMRKRDLDQELTDRVNKETREEIKFTQERYEIEKQLTQVLKEKVANLEEMIRVHFQKDSQTVEMLKSQILARDKYISILKLKLSPEVAEMMKIHDPEGIDLTGLEE